MKNAKKFEWKQLHAKPLKVRHKNVQRIDTKRHWCTRERKKWWVIIYLNILKSADSIFTGAYLHYIYVPKETMFERSIAERTKLRRERLDEIKRKELNINDELF